jgi:hypothetical protein
MERNAMAPYPAPAAARSGASRRQRPDSRHIVIRGGTIPDGDSAEALAEMWRLMPIVSPGQPQGGPSNGHIGANSLLVILGRVDVHPLRRSGDLGPSPCPFSWHGTTTILFGKAASISAEFLACKMSDVSADKLLKSASIGGPDDQLQIVAALYEVLATILSWHDFQRPSGG